MRRFKRTGLTLMALLMISCWSKEQIVTKYFLLNDPSPSNDSLLVEFFPIVVQVNPLTIAEAYNQQAIALKTKSRELNYFYYNKWAESPAIAIRYFLWKKIKQAGIFQVCEMRIIEYQPQFSVSGAIHHIERLRLEDNHAAHLSMSLEFIEIKSGIVLAQHEFDRILPIEEESNMNLFAEKISQILAEELQFFIDKMNQTLKEK